MTSHVDIRLPAVILQGSARSDALVSFHWDSANPAEVAFLVQNIDVVDVFGNEEIWQVSRSTFLVAMHRDHQGTWAGLGSFSVKYTPRGTVFALRPMTAPQDTWAHVLIPNSEQVHLFIAHTLELCPTVYESTATLELVDQALAELFA